MMNNNKSLYFANQGNPIGTTAYLGEVEAMSKMNIWLLYLKVFSGHLLWQQCTCSVVSTQASALVSVDLNMKMHPWPSPPNVRCVFVFCASSHSCCDTEPCDWKMTCTHFLYHLNRVLAILMSAFWWPQNECCMYIFLSMFRSLGDLVFHWRWFL